jgi:hypothetical protein
MSTRHKVTGRYHDQAQLWRGDEKCADVRVRLTGWVRVDDIPGVEEPFESTTTWDGFLEGMTRHQLGELVSAGQFELRLTNGQSAQAVLTDMRTGHVQGIRETPF